MKAKDDSSAFVFAANFFGEAEVIRQELCKQL